MKRKLFYVMSLLLLASGALNAQVIVVANNDITYEDPRWGVSQVLEKGSAISVQDAGTDYEWWLYPAAFVSLPKKNLHIPGTKAGERCVVINGTNARFREKPSAKSGILCYDIASGASYYSRKFVRPTQIQRDLKEDGIPVYWDPYYLPKGTRLPYLGKTSGFYKTSFNGLTLYISARHCYLK